MTKEIEELEEKSEKKEKLTREEIKALGLWHLQRAYELLSLIN